VYPKIGFGEARPVATTIEAGHIDGRAKIKIKVSAWRRLT
jgi:hypothetical protein